MYKNSYKKYIENAFPNKKYELSLHRFWKKGAIAQLVEQRTENPCVPGSIPGGTTQKIPIPKVP